MKKLTSLFLALALMFCMSGCSLIPGLAVDEVHAYAEITSSSGVAKLLKSVNGSSGTYTGLSGALQIQNTFFVPEAGEVFTVHFVCDTCGHDEICELEAPAAKLLTCDCLDTNEENYNSKAAKEYIAIALVVGEKPEEPEEKTS